MNEKGILISLINETWLSPNDVLEAEGYSIIRKDREVPNRGGGVCIIISEDLTFERIPTPHNLEAIAAKIHCITPSNEPITLVSYYNPPDKQIDKEFIRSIFTKHQKTILTGDLNGHHPLLNGSKTDHNGAAIKEMFTELDLVLLQSDQPTYCPLHRDYRARLDLVLHSMDLAGLISNFEVSDELRSDHLSLLVTVTTKPRPTNQLYVHKVKTTNWEMFKEIAQRTAPAGTQLLTQQSIEEAINATTKTIQIAIEQSTTTKLIKKKE